MGNDTGGRSRGQLGESRRARSAQYTSVQFLHKIPIATQHLRREDRGSDSNPVSLVQMRLVPALRPAQAPHFDASPDLLAALVAVPSTLDLSAPL